MRRAQQESFNKRFSDIIHRCGLHFGYEHVVPHPKHLGAAIPRKHMYHMRLAHEHVSLVHVDVATVGYLGSPIDLDRLDQHARAQVVQEGVLIVCAEERRVHDSVCGREFRGEYLGPRPEVATRRVSVVRCRGGRRNKPLFLIWRRCMGGLFTPNDNVTSEAPNFLAANVVKDEISIVILAVCLGMYIMLEPVEYPEEIARGRRVRGFSPGGDSTGERRRRDGSRRGHLKYEW